MTTLTIMRGVSGSGKSTRATEIALSTGAEVVSRDSIRLTRYGVEYGPPVDESRVTIIEHAMIEGFLKSRISVVSDNTNIDWNFVKQIAKIGRDWADIVIEVVDVPLEQCILRNDKRAMMGGRFVPHHVIRRQYEQFQTNKDNTL